MHRHLRNVLLAVTVAVVVAVAIVFVVSRAVWRDMGGPEDQQNATLVQQLLNTQASREEVTARFGEGLVDYSVGSHARPHFERSVANVECSGKLREHAARYPGVLHHTTMWTMTWMFFDADGRLRAYVRCAQ